MDGGDGQVENPGEGIERRFDVDIRINGGFGFGGRFGERIGAEIGSSAFEGMGEALGGGRVVGGEGVVYVRDSGGLGVGEALQERFVAFTVAAGAFEGGGGVDAGDGEGIAGAGIGRKRDPSLRSG